MNYFFKKMILSIMIIFLLNGCASVGLDVSSSIDSQLIQKDWESVNSQNVKEEIK